MKTLFGSCYRRAYIFIIQTRGIAASEYAIILSIAALIALAVMAALGADVANTMNMIGDMLENNHFCVEH